MVDLQINNGWVSAAVLVALLLLVGHWLPWPNLTGRKLGRVASYTYGTSALLIGMALWLDSIDQPHLAIGLFLLCAAGGGAVVAGYTIDALGMWISRRRRVNNAADRH